MRLRSWCSAVAAGALMASAAVLTTGAPAVAAPGAATGCSASNCPGNGSQSSLVATAGPADPATSASVTPSVGDSTATPSPSPAAQPAPDLNVGYVDSGPAIVGRGEVGEATVLLANLSNDAVARAAVTFTLPAALTFVPGSVRISNSGRSIPCVTSGRTTRCAPIPLGAGDVTQVQVDFRAAAGSAIGTPESIGVHVEPIGAIDPDPADNSVTVPVLVLGNARLVFSVAAAGVTAVSTHRDGTLPLHQRTLVSVRVRNIGPDPAPGVTIAFGQFGPEPGFVVTNGRGHPLTAEHSSVTADVGTIAVGHTVTRHFYVTATKLGGSGVSLFDNIIGAGVNLLGLYCDDRACNAAASLLLTAVPATPRSSSSTSVSVSPTAESRTAQRASAHVEALAATGSAPGGALAGGVLALLLGAGLCVAGRRRPAHADRRH